MFRWLQTGGWILAVLVIAQPPAAAQVSVGQNVELSSGGDLSFGYSGFNGNRDVSSHSLDLGGHGWLRGFYYKPQFLSFDFQPYYRRSQNTSIFQTITNGSGITANTSIFSGSRFPGTVSFGKTYDSSGQFGVPGITGITSHGNGESFSIGWSALLPDMPTLSAIYSTSSGDSTVFGANAESSSNSRNFTLQSTYQLGGFDLMGQYFRLSTRSTFPAFLENGETQESRNRSNAFLFSAGHRLPLTGHWNLVWNHSNFQGTYRNGNAEGSNNGVVNDLNSTVSLNPTRKMGLMFGGTFNDNAFGTLQERILESGGIPFPSLSTSLQTLSVNSQASYAVLSRLSVYGRVNHYERWFGDDRRGMTQLSGNGAFSFARPLFGSLTFSLGLVDTFTQEGNSGASIVGNVTYLRRLRAWELGADFSYTQQVQTLFDVYTTSTYRYGASVKRRFHSLQWVGSFNGSHSGMTQFEGYRSRSEGISTSVIFSRFSVNGHYTQSGGSSILTSAGLIEVPPDVPPPLLRLPVLYDAKSYGGGASFRPFRRATISAGYNRARSATAGPVLSTGFQSTIFNSRFQYRLRKLDVEGNYTRFKQDITTAALPAVINSYYIRFSRWFNLF
ncbi:MAG: hypothetical protein ACE145_04535 [Terriglobia bacterium]